MATQVPTAPITIRPMAANEVLRQMVNHRITEIRIAAKTVDDRLTKQLTSDLAAIRRQPKVKALVSLHKAGRRMKHQAETALNKLGLSIERYGSDHNKANFNNDERERRLSKKPEQVTDRINQIRRFQSEGMTNLLGMPAAAAKIYLKKFQHDLNNL